MVFELQKSSSSQYFLSPQQLLCKACRELWIYLTAIACIKNDRYALNHTDTLFLRCCCFVVFSLYPLALTPHYRLISQVEQSNSSVSHGAVSVHLAIWLNRLAIINSFSHHFSWDTTTRAMTFLALILSFAGLSSLIKF